LRFCCARQKAHAENDENQAKCIWVHLLYGMHQVIH